VSGRPPVLALHGQPGSGRDFEPLGRALAGEWRMVAPDRPGWGSRAGEPARGFAAGADDAVAVLDREGVDRAIVLGFSWGGGVALELARRHPDRVGGLVLAASIGPGEPTVADRLLALPVAGRAISAGGLAATRLVLRRPSFHGIVGRGMKGVDPNHVRRFVDDCMSAPTSARRLAEAIPGAELRIVPGAGHFLPGASAPVLAEAVVGVAARAGLAGR